MGIVFMFAGYGWALWGLAIFANDTDWAVVNSDASEAVRMAAVSDLGFIIAIVMVLPGLLIAGIGHLINAQKKR